MILAHPDAVKELYTHGPDEVDSGVANMALRPLLGTRNVLLLDGPEHLRRRKLVLPPLHGKRMREYEDVIRDATRREIATWPLGRPEATLPRMHAITLRVVLRAVFGVEDGPRLERLGGLLRHLTSWTTDARRALIFGFLGPDWLMGLDGFRRQAAAVDAELYAEDDARRREAADLGDDGAGHPLAAPTGAGRERRGAHGRRAARRADDAAGRRARDDRRGAELGAHGAGQGPGGAGAAGGRRARAGRGGDHRDTAPAPARPRSAACAGSAAR